MARRVRHISGWFEPDAAALFALLDDVQRHEGTTGGLFEIGVHHGRSAVLLCVMARRGESVGVCDVFGKQGLNVSASGSGNRAIFERNVAEFAPGFDRLVVHEKSSAQLRPEEIAAPQRLFHVDGGHALDEALNDIRLGAHVLHPRGAIVVDDPFRAEWPGVTEAALQFLDEHSDFSAIVVGFNKLVLVRDDARPAYERVISSPWHYFDHRVHAMKTAQIRGQPCTVFHIPTYRQAPALVPIVARTRWLDASLRHRFHRLRSYRRT